MSNLTKFLELETEEERRAFVAGLSPAERFQLWNDGFQRINEVIVDVLAPVFTEVRLALERFMASGVDLTQFEEGDHEQ